MLPIKNTASEQQRGRSGTLPTSATYARASCVECDSQQQKERCRSYRMSEIVARIWLSAVSGMAEILQDEHNGQPVNPDSSTDVTIPSKKKRGRSMEKGSFSFCSSPRSRS